MSRVLITGTSFIAATAFAYYKFSQYTEEKNIRAWRKMLINDKEALNFIPPSRKQILEQIQEKPHFDILVIGGGATGIGCALDAAVKGLDVVCVERGDFASETSSKSTKLVHGGVRYLEKAITTLDFEQYKLVTEALRERANFFKIAPHLTQELPILLPLYGCAKVPYFWIGSKVYDLLSGKNRLSSSYFLSKQQTMNLFPNINDKRLCGSMVYFDGQQNDSRMNVTLALTAIYHGAKVVNYVEVKELIKSSTGSVVGAKVKNKDTGEEFPIYAKCIINATGPFSDSIRRMAKSEVAPYVCASSGTHIVLPLQFSSDKMGLLDPQTNDGRMIFVLPWEGRIIAGTTDEPTTVQYNPQPTEKEIEFILSEISKNMKDGTAPTRKDILAAWSGIRPLIRNPSSKNTESLVRNHLVDIADNGLVSISGGKWTTYRNMSEETIDLCIAKHGLQPKFTNRSTMNTPLIGSHGYSNMNAANLIKDFSVPSQVATHLARSYGDRASKVLELDSEHKYKLLAEGFPYLEAEVKYAVRYEYAMKITDVIARRLRLAFLDVKASELAISKVADIMSKEFGWNGASKTKQIEEAHIFLETMGKSILK